MSSKTILILPYFEDPASSDFCKQLAQDYGTDLDLIIVDDGSVKTQIDPKEMSKNGLTGQIIRLRRNVGHQCAIAIGLAYAVENLEFSRVVIMDMDGEDNPNDIKPLLQKLSERDVDIVVAERASREESIKFKLFYIIYKFLFRILVGKTIGFGNFMAMSDSAARRLVSSRETQTHLAGSVLNSRLRVESLKISRGKRYAGNSSMNFVSLTLHGLKAVTVFTESVLVRISLFCALFISVILVMLAIMIVLKIAGLTIVGWFSTVSGILLLLLFQAAMMALLVLLLSGNIRSAPISNLDHNSIIKDVINVK